MRLNVAHRPTHTTHEGAPARRITAEEQLRRSVAACLLWEDGFYEDGKAIGERIRAEVAAVSPQYAAQIARQARGDWNLRHVPLLIARELARTHQGKPIGDLIRDVVQRADELAEFLALYWSDGRQKLSAQVKRGLAEAFPKFDAYQLAKYNRDGAVKLRDVMFLTHPKPKDEAQASVWKQLVEGTLPAPDTWEVALSSGADKKAAWERLIREGKLGYLALLRNLRNMTEVDVDRDLVEQALLARKGAGRVLPFRFVAAARHAPAYGPVLNEAMLATMREMPRLPGRTVLLVDVSGSMGARLSAKSDLSRLDAAAALAVLLRGVCEKVAVLTFSTRVVEVSAWEGLPLVDAIHRSQDHLGTYLGAAVNTVNAKAGYDRLIVVTDEQSYDVVPSPTGLGYMINVASNRNGVGYGPWQHIDGFSESVVRYIQEVECRD